MSRKQYFGVRDQSKASLHRLADAKALFRESRWHGAMYVAGYSVECLLKSKLMEKFRCRTLKQLQDKLKRRGLLAEDATMFTHQLELLLRLADGYTRIQRVHGHWELFKLVNQWVPAWRYSPDLASREDAEDFLNAVDQTLHWIQVNT